MKVDSEICYLLERTICNSPSLQMMMVSAFAGQRGVEKVEEETNNKDDSHNQEEVYMQNRYVHKYVF